MIRRLFGVLGSENAAPLRQSIAGITVGAVLQGIGFTLLVPLLQALFDGDTGEAWWWAAALVALLAVYAVVHFASQMSAYRAAVGLSRGLFSRLGDHIATLPLGWFTGDQVGRVGRLTSQGVIDVMGVPAHLLRPLISAFVTPATVVAVMFVFDWRLALAALVTAPVALAVYRWSNGLTRRADIVNERAAVETADRIVEFGQSQAVLRAFGRTAEGHALLDDALVAQRRAGRRLLLNTTVGMVAFGTVVQTGFNVVLLVGTDLALGGSLGAAELVALLVLAVRFVEPMATAAELGSVLKMARNTLDRMDTLLSTAPLPEPASSRPFSAVNEPSIELDHVSFAYDDRQVLADVTFTVPARTMCALVGPSGAGKTTVTRLIARFWDVDRGVVRVGGSDVRDLTTGDLMSQLAMVFQDVYLFDGTIAENVRLARPDATDEELAEAGRLARVDEVVERLPDGWDTRVGEGGFALSGGERQRVSIARAILKDAPIVLLDEATAALDAENEAAVRDALAALTAERTLLVIAHRLQTIAAADQIVVLDGGRVADAGTHTELLARGGRYAEFWRQRTRAQGWRLATTDAS